MRLGSRSSAGKLATALAVIVAGATPVLARAPIAVQYTDAPGEGFDDAELGLARRTAFEAAVDHWARIVDGTVPIVVQASFDPLGGTSSRAILGQASTTTIHRDFAGAPRASTWYAAPLANELAGTDLNGPFQPEIFAQFNSDVDGAVVLGSTGWYYGTDAQPGRDVDFVTVALHELCHGLGFFDTVDPDTGGWAYGGAPDSFSLNLFTPGLGRFDAMTAADRRAAITSGNVSFVGGNVVQAKGAGAPIYAPDPYAPGSSISHFDPPIAPDELMEPFYVGPNHSARLAVPVLEDIGWTTDEEPLLATCELDEDCDDGNVCDGAERCEAGTCEAGAALTCAGRAVTVPFCTDGPDSIEGTDGDDVIAGAAGDDTLSGGPGADLVCGQDGSDVIVGNEGQDTVRGGAGADTILGGRNADDLRGEQGDDSIAGQGGTDTLFGGKGNDTLSGDGGVDVVDGQGGTDRCRGERLRNCEATSAR
ncbi:MAG: hypothetical protein QOD06_1160 [Candidatus Binatota bacterium]|jgi:Ca2+-binding RTX toxin-like protein|nr:hypothetical protein [Candidatus Binatota bacterium]